VPGENGEATLADVLEDKDATKLCCYMLSSLLLVNAAFIFNQHSVNKFFYFRQTRKM